MVSSPPLVFAVVVHVTLLVVVLFLLAAGLGLEAIELNLRKKRLEFVNFPRFLGRLRQVSGYTELLLGGRNLVIVNFGIWFKHFSSRSVKLYINMGA